jgi:hypothetical protein
MARSITPLARVAYGTEVSAGISDCAYCMTLSVYAVFWGDASCLLLRSSACCVGSLNAVTIDTSALGQAASTHVNTTLFDVNVPIPQKIPGWASIQTDKDIGALLYLLLPRCCGSTLSSDASTATIIF